MLKAIPFDDAGRVRRWTLVLVATGSAVGVALGHWAPEFQQPLAVLLIVGIGLQHGALDHILHAHMHGDPEGPLRQSFVLPYLAGIGAAWAAFEMLPSVLIGLFLLVSAYHFGMSHLRVDAMRHSGVPIHGMAGLAIGLALVAPLVLRPDALEVLADFGWDFGLPHRQQHWPLATATGLSILLTALLHRGWKTGMLPLAGAALAWIVPDLLLAFALYFTLGHAREAFLDEFVNRQSLDATFGALYRRSLPLTLAFAGMAAGILWCASEGILRERAALSFLLAGTLPHIAVLEGWVTARTR